MTRILLTIAIVFSFSILASAQFKKGDILLGGNLSYEYNSSDNFYSNSIPQENDGRNNYGYFAISAGKALSENTVAGVALSYSPSTSTNYSGYPPVKSRSDSYSAGVFYRKYKSLGKEFYFYGQVNASYSWSTQSGKDSLGKTVLTGSSWGAQASGSPGIAYKISKHFLMELSIPALISIGYNKTKSSYQDESQTPPTVQKISNENFRVTTSLSSNPLDALAIGFLLIL